MSKKKVNNIKDVNKNKKKKKKNIFEIFKSILEIFSWDWNLIFKKIKFLNAIFIIMLGIIINGSGVEGMFKNVPEHDKKEKMVTTEGYSKEQIDTILSNEDILSEQANVPEYVSETNSYDDEDAINEDMQNDIIPEGWLFFDIPSTVREINEYDKIAAYSDFYKQLIDEKVECIDKNEKITQEYIEYILEANEIFSKYDEEADIETKNGIIENAVVLRLEAKRECRQTSNEQNLANLYALCGANFHENNFMDKEFTYYNYAIDMYLNGYSVSLVKDKIPKIISLDYIMTCFLNIYGNNKFSDEIRRDALYSAAAFDLMYKEKLEYYKKTDSMTKEEHGVHMDLGEIYIKLCKDVNANNKLYYYNLAYKELILCPQYPCFGKKLANRVYKDLIYLTQYCYENINEEYYQDTFTKNDMYSKHIEFQRKLKEYAN